MMTAEELMDQYKKVREEEGINGGLGLITNPQAQVGGMLLVGLNPSGEGDEIHNYISCKSDFWDPKHEMMGLFDKKCGYIDLLPVRNGRQAQVHIDNDLKNRYHGRLLAHTRDYIEELRPRLIIFANSANYYWGFRKEWMGYSFNKVKTPLDGERKRWKLFQITGIEPTGVNRFVHNTNLVGTFFLQYRQHKDMFGMPVPKERELRFVDIQTIAKFIDDGWEKTLY
jgi:hypothetical protein